mmetsp:Transcript_6525/g.11420  ORF Transcript_6525/g.11420 Transcript_6525/m.11420 type:complete len:445 (-) Transcript_6525:3694-5028(-)
MNSQVSAADRTAELQLIAWVETAVMLFACVTLLNGCQMFDWPFTILLGPAIGLEIKQTITVLLRFPTLCSMLGRSFVILELLGYGCNFLCIAGLLLFYGRLPSILIVSPLFFKIFFRVFMRRVVTSECSSFSELVRCIVATVKFLTLSFVAFKLDDVLDVSWNTVFWACWLLIALLFVVSTGVFLLFTGAVCTWAVNEAESLEVLACAWLFFSTAGATLCLAIILAQIVDFLDSEEEMSEEFFTPKMYIVHGFLILFVIMTVCNKTKIAHWWNTFFYGQDEPASTERATAVNKIYRLVKAPSRLLVKVSSTYYVPASPTHVRRRSDSDIEIGKKIKRIRFRSLDGTEIDHHREKTDISFVLERLNCSLCCEKTADSVFMPCGHGGVCNKCAMRMWQKTEYCHLCRKPIEKVILIPETPSTLIKPKATTAREYPTTTTTTSQNTD